jgi:hypothetical protein
MMSANAATRRRNVSDKHVSTCWNKPASFRAITPPGPSVPTRLVAFEGIAIAASTRPTQRFLGQELDVSPLKAS